MGSAQLPNEEAHDGRALSLSLGRSGPLSAGSDREASHSALVLISATPLRRTPHWRRLSTLSDDPSRCYLSRAAGASAELRGRQGDCPSSELVRRKGVSGSEALGVTVLAYMIVQAPGWERTR